MSNTPQRTFASSVTFSHGLLSAVFDVVPIRLPEKRRVSVCPTCSGLHKLVQVMHCPVDDSHQFDLASAARAIEVDGELVPLPEEDLATLADDGMPTGALALSVCPAAELEAQTRPGEGQYRVRLNKKARSGEQYALFLALVADDTVAYYGEAKLNGRVTPTPFRLGVWQGQLILTSLVRPEALAEVDAIEAECSEELIALGRQYTAAVMAPFNPELLIDSRKVRLEGILARGEAAPVALAIVPAPKKGQSLEELLSAALAA
jgi:hypothetical protein